MSTPPNGRSTSPDRPIPFPLVENEQPEEDRKDNRKRQRDVVPHRRTVSGNILSKLQFLRTSSDEREVEKPLSAMAGAVQDNPKTRKRKGSLRKTVLGKGRDRKGSDLRKSPLSSPRITEPPLSQAPATPRPSVELVSPVSPDSPPKWPVRILSKASIPSIRSSVASVEPASSIVSPTLGTDVSTDDDELTIPPRMPAARKAPPSSSGDSYFPMQESIRRKIARQKSPLAAIQAQAQIVSPTTVEEEDWDYSETAFWGWVILIVTWIVFVVGMGSSFGVWSWAWDVGETPKAPPELEDDPTLPIVGYYPALMVLTCVMAWVWVVVAWVGMKYFRHADLRSDDG